MLPFSIQLVLKLPAKIDIRIRIEGIPPFGALRLQLPSFSFPSDGSDITQAPYE